MPTTILFNDNDMERETFEKACKLDELIDAAKGVLVALDDVPYENGCRISMGSDNKVSMYLPQEVASKVVGEIRDYWTKRCEKWETEFKEL